MRIHVIPPSDPHEILHSEQVATLGPLDGLVAKMVPIVIRVV